jgi:FlaA1/EpsC-like NDP-sugar epimerase
MSDATTTLTPRTRARATQALTVLDAATWVVAIAFAACVRYDFDFSQVTWRSIVITCVFAVIMQIIFGFGTGLYRRRFVSGSFSEIRALFGAVFLTGAIVGIPVLVIGFQIHVARSTMLIAFPVAFILMGTVRLVARMSLENRLKPGEDAKRTLIFGSGSLADHLVRRMVTDGASPYVPVGLIDDDPAKKNLRISGVPVLGDRRQIATAALKSRAEAIIIGVARADGPLLREISDLSREAGLRVLVLPPLDEILKGKSSLRDVRDIAIDDILGRHSVDTQVESIAGYLDGRRVLVTGAGGSIGSELCRQIMRFSPAELIMLDHDETALQQVQLSISGHGLLDSREALRDF